ncbi:phosphonate ABC transporter ATP-binding protein [Pseudogulbenkiania ferrooxidans]|uniref:ABC transporter related protein n=1 Tax=Pseudogulbenkiania ferrooxidans 2002 TaxID=279714 RepID=B9Z119_9NEIS|nr:ATP-binding cassette domain-containing protein [Pseudogulbenkiania ferrooxidans]EEG09114.1 ABC transporter related protein [Pseudogulbenkiania ferrooxidans 2002]
MSLTFERVGLRLGRSTILDDISLALGDGEQAALIGPSGAGKSSLLLLANTVYRPSQGTVSVLGQDPWRCAPRQLQSLQADIGTVYQAPPLPARQRVVNAVAAGRLGRQGTLASLLALLRPHDAAGVAEVLQRVDLADKLWARCDQLSGGQRQRVGIARVLYQAPRLMLADEPVSALDPRLAEETVKRLADDARARGATLLMSLHSVDLALAHFPRIIGLQGGRILFDLPRAEVHGGLIQALYAGERLAEDDTLPADAEPGFPRGVRC